MVFDPKCQRNNVNQFWKVLTVYNNSSIWFQNFSRICGYYIANFYNLVKFLFVEDVMDGHLPLAVLTEVKDWDWATEVAAGLLLTVAGFLTEFDTSGFFVTLSEPFEQFWAAFFLFFFWNNKLIIVLSNLNQNPFNILKVSQGLIEKDKDLSSVRNH